jgi:hypothetical protein
MSALAVRRYYFPIPTRPLPKISSGIAKKIIPMVVNLDIRAEG